MINQPFASNSPIIKIATTGFKSLLNTLFPSICLGCKRPIKGGVLCNSCSDLLVPLKPQGRCLRCFYERPCPGCTFSPFARLAGLFPPFGPPLSLSRALPHAPYLAKACSGLLLHQLEALTFPTFDLIVSGDRKDHMLASGLAKWLKIPHIRALAPAGKGLVQIRRGRWLCHKKALLVTTQWGDHCIRWGKVLQEAFPKRLDGIAFCLSQEMEG